MLQLHLTFGGDIVGVNSDNELYGKSTALSLSLPAYPVKGFETDRTPDHTMRFSPDSPVGIIHDWYVVYSGDANDRSRNTLTL